ncbi:SDR family NAD(P)-dependent oxidoreductase [Kitasatospora sp. NPDC093102]|uniref:SDR family NAD(P)-dependent oxidoreductase n=1 Tax=Kitasatospora sp. NPDC093102 TaxID=3155069 RepID=UPI003429B37E
MTVDRPAVVSGGGTGIGRAIAARPAGEGHRVVLGRRPAVPEQAREEIERAAGPGRVVPMAADPTDPAAVEAAARIAGLGPVDVPVNNAGAIVTPPAGYLTGQAIGLNGGALLGR